MMNLLRNNIDDLSLYRVEIRVRTPLILSGEPLGRIWATNINFIPGSTFRGALLSYMYNHSHLSNRVVSEAFSPTVYFQPLLPVYMDKECRHADPLIYKCKICGETVFYRPPLDDYISFPSECNNGHYGTLKSVGGALIVDKDVVNVIRYVYIESVGINKVTETSEKGMLYSYSAIAPNTRFKGLVLDRGGLIQEYIDNYGYPSTIYLGRGISRGFGWCELNINQIDVGDYINNRGSQIHSYLEKSNYLVLRGKSPLVFMDSKGFTPKPKLVVKGLEEHIPFKYVDKNYLLVRGLYHLRGFGANNLPKAHISAVKPGSIFFYKIKSHDKLDDLVDHLVELELLGLPPYNHIGLNYLEVLVWC